MRYAILTAIGNMYKTEAGHESAERFPILELAATRLQAHIKLAERLKAAAHGPAEVATGLPNLGGGKRVKELVGFHNKAAGKWALLAKVNAEVAFLRKWLSRQGVHQTFDGKIIWEKSRRKVEYDSSLEKQGLTRIAFRNGLMYLQDKPFDTRKMVTHFSGPGCAIYVMSQEGHFHVGSHAVGHRHHSSLLAGQNVAGAGEMKVDQGRLVHLSNKSGHYHPDLLHFFQTLGELQAQNVSMMFSISKSPENAFFPTADKFMQAYGADDRALEAQKLLKMLPPDNLSYFLKNHDLAFLSAGVHNDVNTTGFHRIADGQPPYWMFPDQIRQMMLDDNLPLQSEYIKAGKGR